MLPDSTAAACGKQYRRTACWCLLAAGASRFAA